MTVNEMLKELQELVNQGYGEAILISQAVSDCGGDEIIDIRPSIYHKNQVDISID